MPPIKGKTGTIKGKTCNPPASRGKTLPEQSTIFDSDRQNSAPQPWQVSGMNSMQSEKYALWDLERAVKDTANELEELARQVRDQAVELASLTDTLKDTNVILERIAKALEEQT